MRFRQSASWLPVKIHRKPKQSALQASATCLTVGLVWNPTVIGFPLYLNSWYTLSQDYSYCDSVEISVEGCFGSSRICIFPHKRDRSIFLIHLTNFGTSTTFTSSSKILFHLLFSHQFCWFISFRRGQYSILTKKGKLTPNMDLKTHLSPLLRTHQNPAFTSGLCLLCGNFLFRTCLLCSSICAKFTVFNIKRKRQRLPLPRKSLIVRKENLIHISPFLHMLTSPSTS